jgi:hypothetical protein
MSDPSVRLESEDPRLQVVRDAAAYKAWRDMLSKFSDQQRQHVAMLLAHDWLITGVTLSHDDGRIHYVNAADYWPPYFSGVLPVAQPVALMEALLDAADFLSGPVSCMSPSIYQDECKHHAATLRRMAGGK